MNILMKTYLIKNFTLCYEVAFNSETAIWVIVYADDISYLMARTTDKLFGEWLHMQLWIIAAATRGTLF